MRWVIDRTALEILKVGMAPKHRRLEDTAWATKKQFSSIVESCFSRWLR
jgi:hypothetical protein